MAEGIKGLFLLTQNFFGGYDREFVFDSVGMQQQVPTCAFGARTAVFGLPRAFHSPWFRVRGAIFQASGRFRRRHK